MKVMEIDVSTERRSELIGIASLLGVDDYPCGIGKFECLSWIDDVVEMLREEYELNLDEMLVVFHHLGVDAKGLGYVCGLFGIEIN